MLLNLRWPKMIMCNTKHHLTTDLSTTVMKALGPLLRNCNIDLLKNSIFNSFLLFCGSLSPSLHLCLFSIVFCNSTLQSSYLYWDNKKISPYWNKFIIFFFLNVCLYVCCAFKYTLFLSWIPLCGWLGNWSGAPKRTGSITSWWSVWWPGCSVLVLPHAISLGSWTGCLYRVGHLRLVSRRKRTSWRPRHCSIASSATIATIATVATIASITTIAVSSYGCSGKVSIGFAHVGQFSKHNTEFTYFLEFSSFSYI